MSTKPTQRPIHSNIEFRDLGKIKEATVQIRPFTVIAGCNSSGKSFISKSLYSLFSGIGSIDNESLLAEIVGDLLQQLRHLNLLFRPDSAEATSNIVDAILKLERAVVQLDTLTPSQIERKKALPFIATIRECLAALTAFVEEDESIKLLDEEAELDQTNKLLTTIYLREIHSSLTDLIDYFSNPSSVLNDALTGNLAESFRDNFTIPSTRKLTHFDSERATIRVSDIGFIEITDNIQADNETLSKVGALNLHPPIYLESPIYWKLSDALDASRRTLRVTAKKRNLSGNQLVSKVPKYFFDVVELLDDQVKTEEFSDIAQTIENAIKGSLTMSDGGIQFVDKASNKAVSLSVTALGVTNLGMIALLLRRGAILPGTFLFIDEPEVHLHPMWQVVLVQVLHELSKRGVNVVIASHSIDIMKAIENIMNSDDDIDQQTHFGLNQLTEDGRSVDVTDNNFKRIAAIKEDLGKPFYDMFMGA